MTLRLETWLPLYDRICSEFGYDKEQDFASARDLAAMLGDRGIRALAALREKAFPRSVLICGGSDGLADELSSINIEGFVVSADSATSVLMDAGIDADIIVTDLDGVVEDQIDMNRRGAVVFVHAHGDNRRAIARYVEEFEGALVGTCQCEPPQELVNFGGFTDGDRAACICAELGARRIRLAGFDFRRPSEKLGKSAEVKAKKLKWARRILDILAEEGVELLPAVEGAEPG